MSTRQCPTEQLWRGGEEAGTGTIIVGYAKTKQALNKKKILNKGTLFLTKPKTTTTTATSMCGRQTTSQALCRASYVLIMMDFTSCHMAMRRCSLSSGPHT